MHVSMKIIPSYALIRSQKTFVMHVSVLSNVFWEIEKILLMRKQVRLVETFTSKLMERGSIKKRRARENNFWALVTVEKCT